MYNQQYQQTYQQPIQQQYQQQYGYQSNIPKPEYSHITLPQQHAPLDTISNIKWLNDSCFYFTSWDGLFQVIQFQNQNFVVLNRKEFNTPILSSLYVPNLDIFVLSFLNKKTVLYNYHTNQETLLIDCTDYVSQIELYQPNNTVLLFQTNWLQYINLNNNQQGQLAFTFDHVNTSCSQILIISAFTNTKFSVYSFETLFQNKPITYQQNPSHNINKVLIGFQQRFVYFGEISGRIKVVSNYQDINNNANFSFFACKHEEGNSYDVAQVNDLQEVIIYDKTMLFVACSLAEFVVWSITDKTNIIKLKLNPLSHSIDYNKNTNGILIAHGYDWQTGINGLSDIKGPVLVDLIYFDLEEILRKKNI